MSAPYLNDLAGITFGDLGSGIAPPNFATGIDGPALQNYAAQPNSALGVPNNQPPTYSTYSRKVANYSITRHFNMFPWPDDSHELIRAGMLSFVGRVREEDTVAEHILSIGKINDLIRDNVAEYRALLEWNDGQATRFRDLLKQYGEDRIALFANLMRKYEGKVVNIEDKVPNFNDLSELYNLATKDILCYVTKFGILSRFNYVGPVHSIGMRAESLQSIDMTDYTDHLSAVGVVMKGKARVSSLWSSAEVGDHLYLVLRRHVPVSLPFARTQNTQYQFVPYSASPTDALPSDVMTFTDAGGKFKTHGHVIRVGRVNRTRYLGDIVDNTAMDEAAGLGVPPQRSYESTAAVPFLNVDVL